MKFTPQGAGFAPPPGSGSIEQGLNSSALTGVQISIPGGGFTLHDTLNVGPPLTGTIDLTVVTLGVPFAARIKTPGEGYTNNAVYPCTGGSGAGCSVIVNTRVAPVVRMRTIQNGNASTQLRQGEPDPVIFQPPPATRMRTALGLYAKYWADVYTAGDRAAWDAAAAGNDIFGNPRYPPGFNGFEAFMQGMRGTAINSVFGNFFATYDGHPINPFPIPPATPVGPAPNPPFTVTAITPGPMNSHSAHLEFTWATAPADTQLVIVAKDPHRKPNSRNPWSQATAIGLNPMFHAYEAWAFGPWYYLNDFQSGQTLHLRCYYYHFPTWLRSPYTELSLLVP